MDGSHTHEYTHIHARGGGADATAARMHLYVLVCAAKYHLLLSGDRGIAASRIGEIYQQFCVDEPHVVSDRLATTKKEKLGWLISTLRAGQQA